MVLLMIAGIDTTWSAIGASLWHLAQHPEDRKRLAAEPDAHGHRGGGVPPCVRAGHDGAPRRQGLRVPRLPDEAKATGCSCRSRPPTAIPTVFPDADEVHIDRVENRHAAFGLGIHRCLGSNLARMELPIALEEWMQALPRLRARPTRTRSRGRPARSAARARIPVRIN